MAKDVVMDHVDPVVPLEGYKSGQEFDMNEYVERMFCAASGFQALCGPCHDDKTLLENNLRRSHKKDNKKD